jgi:hypothetical protein
MKTLLTILILLCTFAPRAQEIQPHHLVTGFGVGFTQYGEFDASLEFALIRPKPTIFVSLVGDVFTAKKPVNQKFTTLQAGGRLNYVLIKQSQAIRAVLFGGGKYATQGREKAEGLRGWFWEAGGSVLYGIPSRSDHEVWLKVSASYENLPNARLFCSLGIQAIL